MSNANGDSGYKDCLKSFKLKICTFTQPNLAASLETNEKLDLDQLESLKDLGETILHTSSSIDNFLSIIKDVEDVRSFRLVCGQVEGNEYD